MEYYHGTMSSPSSQLKLHLPWRHQVLKTISALIPIEEIKHRRSGQEL